MHLQQHKKEKNGRQEIWGCCCEEVPNYGVVWQNDYFYTYSKGFKADFGFQKERLQKFLEDARA